MKHTFTKRALGKDGPAGSKPNKTNHTKEKII
jgi:hypothetical protein